MQYATLQSLEGCMPLQKIIECCDDYGVGLLDDAAQANLEAANASAVAEIHLYCRGLYTVPFDPVPEEVVALATNLTKVYLYYRRTAEDVPDAITALHKRMTEQLKGITAKTFRIDPGDDPVAVRQGPKVSRSRKRFPQGFTGGLLDDDGRFDREYDRGR